MTDTNETQVEVTLKPCPFCGGDPLIGQTLDHAWFAMCERDFCAKLETYWRTEAEAITAWNMRIQAEKRNNALAVELREAAKNTTPETWHVVPYGDGDSLVICMDETGNRRIAFMATPGCRDHVARKRSWAEIKANAALIVALRNNLPAILAALEGDE